jgi:endoglucanase
MEKLTLETVILFCKSRMKQIVKVISAVSIIGIGIMFFNFTKPSTISSKFGNGIAMSGLEDSQGIVNPVFEKDYTKNPESNYIKVQNTGFSHVKLAFDWQALEPTLNEPFNPEYLNHIKEQVATAKRHNLKVVLDMHNFGRRGGEEKGQVIGKQISVEQFADTWARLSNEFQNEDGIIAYNLMTEPFEMPVPTTPQNYLTNSTATQMYQKAVDVIRSQGDKKTLIVQLDQWASIANFTANYGSDPKPWISDPENNIMYEVHHYFDKDRSGYYKGEGTTPKTTFEEIRDEATPYLEWCKRNNIKAYIGEIGIPNTPAWQIMLAKYLTFIKTYDANWTYWTMGVEGWYNSPTGVAPNTINRETKKNNGVTSKQLETMKPFVK